MHPILANIPVRGVIRSGEVYILCFETARGWDSVPLDQQYILRSDEDILPALELELCIFLVERYELRQFIRCSEVLDGCYEFRFRCWDKEIKKEVGYSIFLHRLPSLAERLEEVRGARG